MPWHATRSSECPESRPWAVIQDDNGEVMGCHETEDAANAQLAALNATETRSMDFDAFVPEVRSAPLAEAEITGNKFAGYALIYGEVADVGDFTEESQRGAVRKVLSTQTMSIPFVYDHKTDRIPMAFTHAGTLRLAEDTKGMHVEADLPQKNPDADTLREQMERGEVRHMSYGFIAGRGNSRVEQRNGKPHRIITGYNAILDVSPTWCPVYRGTSAELRSALLGAIPDLSQSTGPGADQQPAGEATQDHHEDPVVAEEQEEQRSGVAWEVQVAARRRRLHMMGLTLPR